MDSLTSKIEETIRNENREKSDDLLIQEYESLLDSLRGQIVLEKRGYSLPLPDTLGKAYYGSLNKK